jgi:hypothetical protein
MGVSEQFDPISIHFKLNFLLCNQNLLQEIYGRTV